MITTPVLMQPNIEVNLPKAEVSDNKGSSNIEALISKEGYVYIEGKQVHSSNIEEVVRDLISSNSGQTIVIKGDEAVKYDYVIRFMDKAKRAGVTKFALAVDAINNVN
jgi:biopolymer transport protein ExbD